MSHARSSSMLIGMLHSHVITIFSVGIDCLFLNREIEVQTHALLTGKMNKFQKKMAN